MYYRYRAKNGNIVLNSLKKECRSNNLHYQKLFLPKNMYIRDCL